MLPFSRYVSLLALLLCVQHLARAEEVTAESDYSPGKGWQIPGTGFKLGGYASASVADDRHQETTLGLDNFSLFVHWENDGKLRLFSELDLERSIAWSKAKA